ncbi:hypothetical protein K7X08_020628 [Anisodus acutangulus]|uniref:(S)-2-hydroxy-acid oxidase n=1 Tax=Anisodus acutangulus TaxID=402998 RepID=A0A9Q1MW88_9SOLA|nr:hypothetical protein K7X08_020628 [Anisodus acutangulus]
MEEITNVMEYEEIAKKKLPKMVYDYYASGAEDQWTLAENRNAFSRILFRPRILIDVSKIDMTTTVLGFKISMPIMIAPTAMQKMAHPEGEYATARAASAAGTIMTLSSWATSSVEEVASTGPGIRFFQLYVYKDRNVVAQLVRRAERAGFKAIALTVDTPRLGRREADIKNRFVLPPNLTLKNFEGLDIGTMDKANDSGLASYVAGQVDRTLSWKDVQWLQTITSMPILVKGVLTAEDARIAVQSGAAGIIVSNHGARQLDYVPATITALEEVVKGAQGRVPVFLDGGVRRGTDVFKALALGAAGIFIGRPVVFSLAAEGEAGIRKVLQMLRDEFELTMALSGCRSLSEITRNHIVTDWDAPRAALPAPSYYQAIATVTVIPHSLRSLTSNHFLMQCGTAETCRDGILWHNKLLIEKKYALPYRVLDAMIAHFMNFFDETRVMPVIWHLSLLVFMQRYKTELRKEDKANIRALVERQRHRLITPDILREIEKSKSRGEKEDDSISIDILSLIVNLSVTYLLELIWSISAVTCYFHNMEKFLWRRTRFLITDQCDALCDGIQSDVGSVWIKTELLEGTWQTRNFAVYSFMIFIIFVSCLHQDMPKKVYPTT